MIKQSRSDVHGGDLVIPTEVRVSELFILVTILSVPLRVLRTSKAFPFASRHLIARILQNMKYNSGEFGEEISTIDGGMTKLKDSSKVQLNCPDLGSDGIVSRLLCLDKVSGYENEVF